MIGLTGCYDDGFNHGYVNFGYGRLGASLLPSIGHPCSATAEIGQASRRRPRHVRLLARPIKHGS